MPLGAAPAPPPVSPASPPAFGGGRLPAARPGVPGPLGLLHPFPSVLDALAAAVVALLAGGAVATACAAAAAMGLLQTAIGTTNDLCDVEHDRVARPQKSLPSRRIGRRAATTYAARAALVGLTISFALTLVAGLIAGAGLATGLACDAWLNRTAWSWLPFAVGLPLVPAFGWAAVPNAFVALVALGGLAGAALALANGLADFDADTSAGRGGLAYRLGRGAPSSPWPSFRPRCCWWWLSWWLRAACGLSR